MTECKYISDREAKFLAAVLVVLVLAVAVAGCTAERTHYADGERSKYVEIRYSDALSAGYSTVGEVTLKNIHGESLSSVEVFVEFYDGDVLVGDGRETVRDIKPGKSTRITIPCRGFADRVEVDEIRVIV